MFFDVDSFVTLWRQDLELLKESGDEEVQGLTSQQFADTRSLSCNKINYNILTFLLFLAVSLIVFKSRAL